MRLATEMLAILLLLAILLFLLSPGTVLAVIFLVMLWAAWRRRPRSGVRR
ncbi:hypothetical protein IU500_34365 [Nocardia terpenica]|nr:hypothetical protein [Nocardia terpenica]MBF6065419.1 hypothetical protein [Nocardia terpenica]MBF6109101.1 hypothetical protein [Nocardia terpenica]MBF6114697.1 hypothetical protein [Nocardia terpenica]MBF6123382.1 hypothetical protein [Nocardia terpenica]MBF6156600.1 hypothetical protein [Nocardia terpenica]